jgi:acyl dehydratase
VRGFNAARVGPTDVYHFEDMTVGWSATYGSHEMTETGIVAFAEQFDPQPMHTDPEAAAETQYGGLIASGLHTIGVATRLLVEQFLNDSTNRGGLGIDDLTWHRPVRPGDVLQVRHEVVERHDSDSHPDAGVVVRDVAVLVDEDGAEAATGDGAEAATIDGNGAEAATRNGDADRGEDGVGDVVCSWTVAILMGKRGADS